MKRGSLTTFCSMTIRGQGEQLRQSEYGALLGRLSEITADYAILQLAKLHDRARGKNLSLEYIIENGGWDNEAASALRQLELQLDTFYQQIKPARHKILAHSDLATIQNKQPLGAFEKDADQEYFAALRKFISVVQGRPFEFGAFAANDATTFVDGLQKLLSLPE
jgi:hypothetical protein